jgi:hypothetical protein
MEKKLRLENRNPGGGTPGKTEDKGMTTDNAQELQTPETQEDVSNLYLRVTAREKAGGWRKRIPPASNPVRAARIRIVHTSLSLSAPGCLLIQSKRKLAPDPPGIDKVDAGWETVENRNVEDVASIRAVLGAGSVRHGVLDRTRIIIKARPNAPSINSFNVDATWFINGPRRYFNLQPFKKENPEDPNEPVLEVERIRFGARGLTILRRCSEKAGPKRAGQFRAVGYAKFSEVSTIELVVFPTEFRGVLGFGPQRRAGFRVDETPTPETPPEEEGPETVAQVSDPYGQWLEKEIASELERAGLPIENVCPECLDQLRVKIFKKATFQADAALRLVVTAAISEWLDDAPAEKEREG